MKGIDLSSLVDTSMEMKMDDFNQNILMMSPPASDSGSPAVFSPYSVDSEPGSPLLDDEKVGFLLSTKQYNVISIKDTFNTSHMQNIIKCAVKIYTIF